MRRANRLRLRKRHDGRRRPVGRHDPGGVPRHGEHEDAVDHEVARQIAPLPRRSHQASRWRSRDGFCRTRRPVEKNW